jgi:hypothetical protein
MNVVAVSIVVMSLMLAMACQWWIVRRHFKKRLMDAQARHAAHKQQASELLSAAKEQVANLQHQLAGARLELKRAERNRAVPRTSSAAPRSAAADSLLLMLDDESDAAFDRSGTGFADTTIKY